MKHLITATEFGLADIQIGSVGVQILYNRPGGLTVTVWNMRCGLLLASQQAGSPD